MKHLTVNERINFKSHFPPQTFERIKRVDHYGHYAQSDSVYKCFDIPFWNELQHNFGLTKQQVFRNKF